MTVAEILLTKRRVAREQIDLAIHLSFQQDNPVSANKLAWAATEVLKGIAKLKGISTFHCVLEVEIGPDKKNINAWHKHLKAAYNFSKHADRDPDDIIPNFRPESTTRTLYACSWDYNRIYEQMSWPMFVHQIWFSARNPDIVPAGMGKVAVSMKSILGIPKYFDLKCAAKGAAELLQYGNDYPQEIAKMLGCAWSERIEDFGMYFPKPRRIPVPPNKVRLIDAVASLP